MNIEELHQLSDAILDELLAVWEQAVRSTHHFLTDGKAFVDFAVNDCHIDKVDVNEQNPQALHFYLHMGYRITGRDALDSTGRPFPILHLSR